MLTDVNVKNLALIRESSIHFEKGLNVLTGETGAGKSIVIGSINLALGGKMSGEMVRTDAPYGLVELVFSVEDERTIKKLQELDVFAEENTVIISRRIAKGRSTIKVNGEAKTASQLRQITSLLIDVHGQHDHQSLLDETRHLDIIDKFGQDNIAPLLERVQTLYEQYGQLRKEMSGSMWNEEERLREKSFAEFEVREIEEAQLKSGEDSALEEEYRMLSNAGRIAQTLGNVYQILEGDARVSATELLGTSVREISAIAGYDEKLSEMAGQLAEIESLTRDFALDLSDYMENLSFGEERFGQVSDRLNIVNRMKQKYGGSIEQIHQYSQERQAYLEKLVHFEEEQARLKKAFTETEEALAQECKALSEARKKAAKKLETEIVTALKDLNFSEVQFMVKFSKSEAYSSKGYDHVSFQISTNPGEPIRPLAKVASGGELSRIMLGLRTIMAKEDDIHTLIFDEIDVGISGRTAQLVAEKMNYISRNHQVICITHLPQIAAMADCHYRIEKKSKQNETITYIEKLNEEESVQELVRILGGAKISDTVYDHAKEMKKMAAETKFN